MHIGARWFVFLVFLGIGASFIATTGVLMWEFRSHEWLALMTLDSHLFVFFPTLGLVALFAFFLPASAFVDLYWNHIQPWGRYRFLLGLVGVGLLAYFIAQLLIQTPSRAIWEIRPAALERDIGAPEGCSAGTVDCTRLPILDSIRTLREVSRQRIGLSKLVRNCNPDPLIEQAPSASLKRICVASTRFSARPNLVDDATCCAAQRDHVATVGELYAEPANRSLTGKVHALLLPLKIFLLLVLFVIAGLLALWSKKVGEHYRTKLASIEFGVVVGTVAMLFFPLMSQAFLQSYATLAGTAGEGTFTTIVPGLSLLFGLWTAIMVLFFYHRRKGELEMIAKMLGIAAGALAIIKYDELVSVLARAIGSGASTTALAGLICFSFVLIYILATTTLTGALGPNREPSDGRSVPVDALPKLASPQTDVPRS